MRLAVRPLYRPYPRKQEAQRFELHSHISLFTLQMKICSLLEKHNQRSVKEQFTVYYSYKLSFEISAVMKATLAVTNGKPENLNGIRSHDLCDFRAVVLCAANWAIKQTGRWSLRNDIWNESYVELPIWNQVKLWSSRLPRNFSNCVEKPEKFRTSTGFEPVTSRYRPVRRSNIRTHKGPAPNVSGFMAQLVRASHRHREVKPRWSPKFPRLPYAISNIAFITERIIALLDNWTCRWYRERKMHGFECRSSMNFSGLPFVTAKVASINALISKLTLFHSRSSNVCLKIHCSFILQLWCKPNGLHTSYATLSRGIPWNIPRFTCIPRKYKWRVGYSTVYHEKGLHNYFIPCHRKYSGQQGTMGRLGGILTNIQRISCILIGCISYGMVQNLVTNNGYPNQ